MTESPRSRLGLRFVVVTLAAALAVVATASLGFWQLSRAAEKNRLQASVEARKQRQPLVESTLSAIKDVADQVHTPVVLNGQWLPTAMVYLDNRQMHGRPGFYVLTPLQVQGQAVVVMVQRGWIARNFLDRALLAPVETPAGPVQVIGRLAPPPSRLLEFTPVASAAQGSGSSAIRQNLDLADFAAQTGLPLATHYTVLETGADSQGLQREWPQAASGVGKHYGYAFQWFGLASLITMLYVWFQLITPWRQRRPPRA